MPAPVYRDPPPQRQPQTQPPPHQADVPLPPPVPMDRIQLDRGGTIGLLLPLTGSFSAPAAAVREGFLAEHFAERQGGEVRVYDVGSSPEQLLSAYQRALNDGVAFIVGPLMKEGAAQLATMTPPVPVVSLNYLDAGTYVPVNFHQLGLAPEDEARAAADDAVAQNLRNAVALVPEGDWGTRVLAAFESRIRESGGRVVSVGRYRQGVSDQSEAISQLMGVTASQERNRALTNALGSRPEFDARRRADVDFVFVGARGADARVLLPQFRFYRATGLPHYATSLVYDGRLDAELSGLRFCDMPFMLDPEGSPWATARTQAAGLQSVAAYPRLYALGVDAYRLSAALQQNRLRVGDTLEGASGVLEWGGSSAVHRKLGCVEMRRDRLLPTQRS